MTSDSSAMLTDEEFNVTEVWLEALARGTCDESGFLRAVRMLTEKSPEAGWESLSLLDQYYRRGKIKPEVFKSLKSRLGSQLLGPAMELDVSVPLSANQDSSAAVRKIPPVVRHTPTPDPEPIANAPELTVGPSRPAASPAPPASPAPAAASSAAPPAPAQPVSAGAPGMESIPLLAVTPERAALTEPSMPPAARLADLARRSAGREIAPGDVLRGRYGIRSVLGRGGTGTVFEAIDRYRLDSDATTDQRVALKVLHAQDPRQLTALRREFQHLQSLSHPNIVRAHEYDRDGDVAFFTMEYLSGLSLGRLLAERRQLPLDAPLARAIVRDVGAALAHAHARGIVHGDLNPGNVFITDEGEVRVLDFGAARDPLAGPPLIQAEPDHGSLAAPRFASCQLLEGAVADARDDVYALACLSYLLLAGKHPFADRTALEARDRRMKPQRPAGVSRSEWLALRAGLSFERERRPADVATWLRSFDDGAAAAHLPVLLAMVHVLPASGSRSALPAILIVALLLGLGWWVGTHTDQTKAALAEIEDGAKTAFASASSQFAAWHAEGASSPEPPAAAEPAAAAPAVAPSPGVLPPMAAQPPSRATGPSAQLTPSAHLAPRSRPHIELAVDTIDVPPADPAARVIVQRSGSARGDVGFSWWTESGTAKSGQDFVQVTPRQEHIEAGKGFVSLFVPIVADSTRRRAKSFYVVISNPSSDAALGKRTLTMVTIPATH